MEMKTQERLLTGSILAIVASLPAFAMIWETVSLVQMQEVAPGQVIRVMTYISHLSKGGGSSRAVIDYRFNVSGEEWYSDRYLPGFMANITTWQSGNELAADYPVGRHLSMELGLSAMLHCR
jgi:hypothetical protein